MAWCQCIWVEFVVHVFLSVVPEVFLLVLQSFPLLKNQNLVLVFKCLTGLAPRYLADYFVTCSAIHSRNLRRSDDLILPRCGATRFLLCKEWNDLPKVLQSIKDNNAFKKRLAYCIFNVITVKPL